MHCRKARGNDKIGNKELSHVFICFCLTQEIIITQIDFLILSKAVNQLEIQAWEKLFVIFM